MKTRFASFALVATLFVTLFVQSSFAEIQPHPPLLPVPPTVQRGWIEPFPPCLPTLIIVVRTFLGV